MDRAKAGRAVLGLVAEIRFDAHFLQHGSDPFRIDVDFGVGIAQARISPGRDAHRAELAGGRPAAPGIAGEPAVLDGGGRFPGPVGVDRHDAAVAVGDGQCADQSGRAGRSGAVLGLDRQDVAPRFQRRGGVHLEDLFPVVAPSDRLTVDPGGEGVVGGHHQASRLDRRARFHINDPPEIALSGRRAFNRIALGRPDPLGRCQSVAGFRLLGYLFPEIRGPEYAALAHLALGQFGGRLLRSPELRGQALYFGVALWKVRQAR